jgi:hypothetical protein
MNLQEQKAIPLGKTARRLDGQKFNMLTCLRPVARSGQNVVWLAQCECGNLTNIVAAQLKRVKSCGCLKHRANTPNFVGPRQPREKRVNTPRLSPVEKQRIAAEKKAARLAKKAAENLELADSRARSRLKTAEDAGILSEETLDSISALPVEDIPRALSMATAHEHNRIKQADYAYKLENYPAFRAKEEAKALRRAERREEKKAAEEAEQKARHAAYETDKAGRAVRYNAQYLAVADTEHQSLQEWFFGHTYPNLHSINELKDIYKAVELLKDEGPGSRQYNDAYLEYIATGKNEPTKPLWYSALMEYWYTPMTIPEHCKWINDFNFKDYYYEHTQRSCRKRTDNTQTTRSVRELQGSATG